MSARSTYAVGAFALADAYNLANTTPNIVYELLLGGVLSATLVPVFVDRFEDGDDDAVSAVLTVATVALAVLTVARRSLAAPLLFAVYGQAASSTTPGCRCCGCSCRRCSSTGGRRSAPRCSTPGGASPSPPSRRC